MASNAMCNDCWLSMQNCHDKSICCETEEYDGEKCEWFEPIPEYYEYTGDDPALKGMKFVVSPDSKSFTGYMNLSGRRSPLCSMVGGCYVCNAPCTMHPVRRKYDV